MNSNGVIESELQVVLISSDTWLSKEQKKYIKLESKACKIHEQSTLSHSKDSYGIKFWLMILYFFIKVGKVFIYFHFPTYLSPQSQKKLLLIESLLWLQFSLVLKWAGKLRKKHSYCKKRTQGFSSQ